MNLYLLYFLFGITFTTAFEMPSCALTTWQPYPIDEGPDREMLAQFGPQIFTTNKSGLYEMITEMVSGDDASYRHLWTWSSITHEMNFNIPAKNSEEVSIGEIYGPVTDGMNIIYDAFTTTNFSLFIENTFQAPVEGDYIFTINNVSDAAAIYINDNVTSYCCEYYFTKAEQLAMSKKIVNIPSDPEHSVTSQTVYLIPGITYYLDIFYINLSGDAIFDSSVTLPSGEVHDISEYINRNAGIDHFCEKNVTSFMPGSYSFTTTYRERIEDATFCPEGYPAVLCMPGVITAYWVMTPTAVVTSSSYASTLTESSSIYTPSELSSSRTVLSSASSESLEYSTVVSSVASSLPSISIVSSSSVISSSSTNYVPSHSVPGLSKSSDFGHSSAIESTPDSFTISTENSASMTKSGFSQYSPFIESSATSYTETPFTESSLVNSNVSKVSSSTTSSSVESSAIDLTNDPSSSANTQSLLTGSSIISASASASVTNHIFSNSSGIINTALNGDSTTTVSVEKTSFQRGKSEMVVSSSSKTAKSNQAKMMPSKLSVSTSIYTDELGHTKTVTVKCPFDSNDETSVMNEGISSEITANSNSQKTTTTSKAQKEVPNKISSVVASSTEQSDITLKSINSNEFGSGHNSFVTDKLSSESVMQQQSSSSTSTVHHIEQAPNSGSMKLSSLMFSLLTLIVSVVIS